MKQKPLIYIVLAIVVIGGLFFAFKLSGMNMDNPNSQDSQSMEKTDEVEDFTAQTEVNLEIANYKFVPATIRIKKGTKVTWTNKDIAQHNVAATDKSFTTELVGKNGSVEVTFDKAGTFSYICEPHPYMKGTVIVEEDAAEE